MISDVYFPRVNGVSTSIATFRRSLSELGHRVCLVVPDYGSRPDDDDDIMRIPSFHLPLDPEDRMMKAGAVLGLEATFRKCNFDVLHIQTPFIAHRVGKVLAARLGLPVVETYHTYFEEYLYHYIPFLPRRLMKAAARHFTREQCNRLDAVIVPSRPMLDVLRSYGVQAPVTVNPTGLEPQSFQSWSKQRFREQHGIDPERPVMIHVGRVAHEKNIGFLLDVLDVVRGMIPEVLLVIAGEGPARESLRKRVADKGLGASTLFIDYLPRGPALWECYCAGDVFVFASTTETQGLVLLEAMALGIPVVSTAYLGTKDILAAGRGALVSDGSLSDFSAKVCTVLGRTSLRDKLANEAREYAMEWTARKMALHLVAFYDQVVEGYMQIPALKNRRATAIGQVSTRTQTNQPGAGESANGGSVAADSSTD
jgi:glycosyltransferase involved in cell wall biosynthesis